MAKIDESTASAVTYNMAAVGLANGGITCIQEMVGTVAMDFHLLQSNAAAMSAAPRVSEKLNLEALKKRERMKTDMLAQAKFQAETKGLSKNASAMDMAWMMVPAGKSSDPALAFDAKCLEIQTRYVEAEIPRFKDRAKPLKVIGALKEAAENDIDKTMDILLDHSSMLRTHQVKKSLASVASGLKCWHHFASGVLSYPSNGTLPPRSCRDVCLYVGIFCNSGTAANYISYLRFGCVSTGCNISWWDLPPPATIEDDIERPDEGHH